ncbi:MAG: NAD(P)/FAD-dependent oxidoreductase [Acidimicrobiales bacterium]
MTKDLAVIGGGVVGTAAALRAARAGASVTLFDRHDVGRATDAGAGIVAPAMNSRDRPAQFELAVAAAQAYPELIAELAGTVENGTVGNGTVGNGTVENGTVENGTVENSTGYEVVGLLAVAIGDGELERFDSFASAVLDREERIGHPTGAKLQHLDPDEARSLYPPLGDVRAALFDPGGARVDGRKLAEAMRVAAVAAGVEVRAESADSVERVAASVETVIIAGGAWSPRFGEELNVSIPVEPQRGQIAHLGVPPALGPTASWPMLKLFSDHYQVSWPDHRVAVGATRETGSGFEPHTTAAGVREVLDEALTAAPGLASAEVLEVRVGLRPVTADLMPVIDRLPARLGGTDVVVATGHGPTGLTTGPFSGRLAVELALGLDLSHDVTAFAVDRSFN